MPTPSATIIMRISCEESILSKRAFSTFKIFHRRLDEALHFAVAELGLGLTLELGLRHLDADDRRQPLAHVLALQALRVLLEDRGREGERVQRTRQPRLESDEMRAAFDRADV